MIIMQYGSGLQNEAWYVREERPPHYLRIYWMDGGSVTYRDEKETRTLKKGFLYVFPAQQAYEMTQNPADPIECLYLHADVFPYLLNHLVEIDPRRDEDLNATLNLLRRQVEKPRPHPPLVRAFAAALLQLFMASGVFENEPIDSALWDPSLPVGSATVLQMSRRAGYTLEYYIRTFTKTVGVTPYQYILSQRMNEAVSLMSQGLPLDEIAERVGYASGKSFAGAFKRRFGISPEIYRKYFLKKA